MHVIEIKTEKAFARTNINLGDYVLNPYKGCFHRCLYCYVQTNKFFTKHPQFWQEKIFVKIDFIKKMETEFTSLEPQPSKILIGASTEAYMPYERKYKIMRDILFFLNQKKIPYTILTKSHLIQRDIDLLTQGTNTKIYLTINQTSQSLKNKLEHHTSSLGSMWQTLKILTDNSIPTILYISPAFPFFTNLEEIINRGKLFTNHINIETFNPILLNLNNLRTTLQKENKRHYKKLEDIYSDQHSYTTYWEEIKSSLTKKFPELQLQFFINPYQSYFNNQY